MTMSGLVESIKAWRSSFFLHTDWQLTLSSRSFLELALGLLLVVSVAGVGEEVSLGEPIELEVEISTKAENWLSSLLVKQARDSNRELEKLGRPQLLHSQMQEELANAS